MGVSAAGDFAFSRKAIAKPSRWSKRSGEAGEPTGARGSRRLSVVRAVHEPTRSESEGEHVCGPGVILTASVKGAREISAGRSPLAKQVARAVSCRIPRRSAATERRRRLNAGCGAPANCGSVSPERSEPRSGRYAGCEQVGRRPHHRAARRCQDAADVTSLPRSLSCRRCGGRLRGVRRKARDSRTRPRATTRGSP